VPEGEAKGGDPLPPLKVFIPTSPPRSDTMRSIDLRSDTFTIPPRKMLETILEAELGDDVEREDSTVLCLEETSARMFGMEAGLLVPSGTGSNLVAVMSHCKSGDELICEKQAHVYYYEVGGMAAVAGVMPKLVTGDRGVFTPEQVVDAYRGRDLHFPEATLVTVENTHNRAGGTVWTPTETQAVVKVSHELGMAVHIDGARIFNSAIAQEVDPKELVGGADSLTFCLSKGLCAPIGSVLMGSHEFIERARKKRKMLGGGMRQAGVVAAPGLYALKNMVQRLTDDHANARALARALVERTRLQVDMITVQTNIVIADTSSTGMNGPEYALMAEEKGVLIFPFSHDSVRFVTHQGISAEDVRETVDRLADQ
jgi:threonine aldolase